MDVFNYIHDHIQLFFFSFLVYPVNIVVESEIHSHDSSPFVDVYTTFCLSLSIVSINSHQQSVFL